MGRKNKFLIVILAILAASVLLTSVLTVYLVITRQQGDMDIAEPGEDLVLLLTPTEPVAESRIAYVTDRSDDDDLTAIYVIEVGGGESALNSRYVAGSEDGVCVLPSWSPDGQKIAYLIQVPGEDGVLGEDDYRMEVWVAAVDGSEQIRVSDVVSDVLDSDWAVAAWSPDGTRLAFTAQATGNADSVIYVVRADGSGVEHRIPLEWDVNRVFWSPTGDELLFAPQTRGARMGAHLLYLEGERIVEVYENVQPVDSWGATMDWSPDGTEFVVGHHLSQRVLIVGTDGEPRWAAQLSDGFPVEVAWSPDGAHIAVSASPAPQGNATALRVIEMETGELITAFNDEDRSLFLPNWSPDGNRLLFSTIRDRQEGVPNPVDWPASTLWVYNVASGKLQQLTPGEMHDGMGAWSP